MQHLQAVPDLDSGVVLFSVFYSAFLAVLLAFDREWLAVEFMTMVGVAIILHAFVTGALSDPIDRYGSRIIWLIPLIALGSWRLALGFGRKAGIRRSW